MLRILRRRFALHIVRPYIAHELPGWGRLYNFFVGDYRRNDDWSGLAPRWMRGKLHGFQLLLDLGRWSPRQTFFLGRYYDLQTQLAAQLVLRDGETFVDIGANEGMISLLASRIVGPTGKVIAFEPNPGPRSFLEAAIERNNISNVELRAIGLGSENAELVLNVPKVNSGEGSFGNPAYGENDLDRISCPVRIADAQLAGESPGLIKIDVEGFEVEVLRGLDGTLRNARPVLITEVVAQHLANAGSSAEALTNRIESYGYSGWRMTLRKSGRRQMLGLRPDRPRGESYCADVMWIHRDDAATLARVAGAVSRP